MMSDVHRVSLLALTVKVGRLYRLSELWGGDMSHVSPDGLDGVLSRVFSSFMSLMLWI